MTGPTQPGTARWRRVKEVFDQALELPRGEMTRFLEEECGSDAELRAEVLSLIAALGEAGSFLEDAVVNLAAPRTAAGTRVGPYRLESLLGQGGMGEVYLSTREVDGYPMPVALKLIRHSALTPGAVRRFRMERQILARLHHPGITQLLDGGITEDGRPYLVTEYIEGTSLDKFEACHTMPLRKRLEAFLAVCDAVSYAHRQLVVHGDLKPGNILVSNDDCGIKLVDFGISRLLQTSDDTTEQRPGSTTVPAMTPAWASPEQLRGEEAGIPSDVYSLGRILYFLLTAEQAQPIGGMSPMAYYDLLRTTSPMAPSVRAGDRLLLGDLDNIVSKALEFEPSERYHSVEALAEDVRAHLASRPIAARPHTWRYRTQKFMRRNRPVVVATAAVLVALLTGLGLTLWQARIARQNYERAERRFQDVRRLANTFIFDMDDAIARLPGATAVRGTMVRNSLQYLDSLAQESSDDPSLQEDLANAYEKVGDVQGRPGAMNLGGTAAALQSYRKAEAIRRTLLESTEPEQRDRREEALANTLMRISQILRATGDSKLALETDRTALEMRRKLLDRKPDDSARLRGVASSLTATSASLSIMGGFRGVLELRKEGLRIYEELVRRNPGSDEDRIGLAVAHTRMASILMHEGDPTGAVKHYREALRVQGELYRTHVGQASYQMSLALAHSNLGNALWITRDLRGALEELGEAERFYRPLVEADANEVRARTLLATVRLREAKVWNDLGQSERAERQMRVVLEERRLLAERNPANAGARGEVAEAHGVLGDIALRAKHYAQAATQYEAGLEILEQMEREGKRNSADREEGERMRVRLAEARAKLP